jgi:ketopantoate reductase
MSNDTTFTTGSNVKLLTTAYLPALPPPTISILGAGSMGLLLASMIRCTYPSYPIRLLLHPKSSLLSNPHHHNHNLTKKKQQKIIHVCLQQTFPITPPPPTPTVTTTTKFPRRRMNYSPRIVPIPYQVIRNDCANNNDDDECKKNLHRRSHQQKPHTMDTYIFVTTKAYQALDAIRSIRDRLFYSCCNHDVTTTTTTPATTNTNTSSTTPINLVICCNGALAVVEMIQQYVTNELQHHCCHHHHTVDTTSPISILVSPPPPRIYYGIITHGAYRERPEPPPQKEEGMDPNDNIDDDDDETLWHVVHAGNGTITILPSSNDGRDNGEKNNTIDTIVDIFNTSGLNCHYPTTTNDDTTMLLLWKKLAVNCVINPLTVIYHCSNGALLILDDDENENGNDAPVVVVVPNFESEYLYPICNEIAQVYVAVNGIGTITTTTTMASNSQQWTQNSGHNDNEDDEMVEHISTMMRDYVRQVIRDTAQNRSSTYQDVFMSASSSSKYDDIHHHQLNRSHPKIPRTEMDYFNGYVVAKAQQYQLECPANQRVLKEFNDTITGAKIRYS